MKWPKRCSEPPFAQSVPPFRSYNTDLALQPSLSRRSLSLGVGRNTRR
jgi:hypothetical protein